MNNAASHISPRLTVWERLHMYFVMPLMVGKSTLGFFTETLCSPTTSRKEFKRILAKHLARARSLLTLRQLRYLQPPTGQTISDRCQSEKLHHEAVRLDVEGFASCTLHFIDCKSTDGGKVLLHLHGGGYIYPAGVNHIIFAQRAAKTSASKLVMLEYTLSPESKYPGQLAQGIAALRHLLRSHKPSEIIIGGDSGGGNLTLGMLAHLNTPHPQIPAIELGDDEGEKLRGAFCISPRCSNTFSQPSFTTNASTDIIGAETVRTITSHWHPVVEHVWATPMRGGQRFWETTRARKIILVAGGFECYVDDIRDFAGLIGAQGDVTADRAFFVCPREYHVQCTVDLGLGIEDGVMLRKLMDWFGVV